MTLAVLSGILFLAFSRLFSETLSLRSRLHLVESRAGRNRFVSSSDGGLLRFGIGMSLFVALLQFLQALLTLVVLLNLR